jgi:hypothetical protein
MEAAFFDSIATGAGVESGNNFEMQQSRIAFAMRA